MMSYEFSNLIQATGNLFYIYQNNNDQDQQVQIKKIPLKVNDDF